MTQGKSQFSNPLRVSLFVMLYATSSYAVTVNVDPGAYTGAWGINTQTSLLLTGPRTVEVAPGTHVVVVGYAGSPATFFVTVAADGSVTVPGGSAALGGPGSLTFQTVPVAVNPGAYAGRYLVANAASASLVGSNTIDLPRGLTYFMVVGHSGSIGGFQFLLSSTGVVSVPNGTSAVGGANSLTFNTFTLHVDPGAYAGAYHFANLITPSLSGVRDPVLVRAVNYRIMMGATGSIGGFDITVDTANNVTVQNGVSGLGGPATLSFNTYALHVDPGAYLGAYQLGNGITPNLTGVANPNLIRAVNFHFLVGASGTIASFALHVDAANNVVVDNGTSAVGGQASLTLRTERVRIDPGSFSGGWQLTNGVVPIRSGLSTVALVPGVVQRVFANNVFGTFDLASPCAVTPSTLNMNGYLFGMSCNSDSDSDGIADGIDNCPSVANASQANLDGDGAGDACDVDDDNDGTLDTSDNCPVLSNPEQADTDLDLLGDACDPDDDNDGVADAVDNCPFLANLNQADFDTDGQGDTCDGDDDNDGIADGFDNCISAPNANQANLDGDALGDACDPDQDGDGLPDEVDNCATTANADQLDLDQDNLGDACDADRDGDGVSDAADDCPVTKNAEQADNDGDGVGDACDGDDDDDGVADASDNCPFQINGAQSNNDGDAQGDVCDADDDDDTIADVLDNCRLYANVDQADVDGDALGDVCDLDLDGDGVANPLDNCQFLSNPSQADGDVDGKGDVCDGDLDGDAIANENDNCPWVANTNQSNLDGDAPGDACDADLDGDGVTNLQDNCARLPNPDQLNIDHDSQGDACDPDDDGDGVVDGNDNCRLVANSSQADFDGDSFGDACDTDDDNDGVADGSDACAATPVGTVTAPGNGCSLAQQCPCNGPWGTNQAWRNQGKYVSCVAHASNYFVTLGLITPAEKSLTQSVAASSSCGR